MIYAKSLPTTLLANYRASDGMGDLTYIGDKHYINNQRVIQATNKVHGMWVFHTLNGCQDTRSNNFGLQHDKVYFLNDNKDVLFYVQSSASLSDGALSLQSVVRSSTDRVPKM